MKARAKDERFAVLAVRLGHRRRLRGGLRKIGKAELIAVAHDNGAINRVLQLADIAGPLELRQVSHGLAANAGDEAIFFGAEPRQEVPQQMRDVFTPHPQRRDCQRQDVKAIEQILPEMPALHAIEQFAIGRGDDADVDLHRFTPADRLDGAFLQCAEQLHLRRQWQFRDFVEKQRAAGGFDEFAGVAFGSAGKCPLLVAEQDRLDEVIRDCAAIDRNERF